MNWIVPPWRKRPPETELPEDYVDEWPFVGDQFIAAIRVRDNRTQRLYWDYWVLQWSETGLECDGHTWLEFSESDIEFISRITPPF